MNSLIDASAAINGELTTVDQPGTDGSRVFNKALPAGSGGLGQRKTVKAAQDARIAAAVAQSRMAAEKDPGLIANRSLFIFSEENFIRKYAKIIIEWGYPCSLRFSQLHVLSCNFIGIEHEWANEQLSQKKTPAKIAFRNLQI